MIVDLAATLDQLENGQRLLIDVRGSVGTASRLNDFFTRTADPIDAVTPAAPTASVALSKLSVGALNRALNDQSGGVHVLSARIGQGDARGLWILVDRLTHSGGLSGTVTTAQTANLPTAALPRYTDGVGVMAAVTIWSAIGATASTVSVSYTNSDGTPGRTSTATAIGGSSAQAASRLIVIPLQPGDLGVRSVESVTIAGTTGTAGDFGVVLFKPLGAIFNNAHENYAEPNFITGWAGALPDIDDACLGLIKMGSSDITTVGNIALTLGVG